MEGDGSNTTSGSSVRLRIRSCLRASSEDGLAKVYIRESVWDGFMLSQLTFRAIFESEDSDRMIPPVQIARGAIGPIPEIGDLSYLLPSITRGVRLGRALQSFLVDRWQGVDLRSFMVGLLLKRIRRFVAMFGFDIVPSMLYLNRLRLAVNTDDYLAHLFDELCVFVKLGHFGVIVDHYKRFSRWPPFNQH